MKNYLPKISPLILMLSVLSGCNSAREKNADLSIIYLCTTVLSFLLLIGCYFLVRTKKPWFILLFSSVFVVNFGYSLLSEASCLNNALFANAISYLGSVFLPFSMLMIILNVANIGYKRLLPITLLIIATIIFLIAASPGFSNLYYKEVYFQQENGVSSLVKTYGPLHPLYFIYLVGYFISMIAVIIKATVKKTVASASHAIILAVAVFLNILVWLIEQIYEFDFEMLSISYIITEVFLLGIHLIIIENQKLKVLIKQKESANTPYANSKDDCVSKEIIEYFSYGVTTLTPTEKIIYEAYLCGTPTKEIMSSLNIKENTLKFHNKNIYSKLGVSSRKQLIQVEKCLNSNAKQ